MNRDLHDYRDSYEKGELLLDNTAPTPFEQFSKWFEEVEAEGSTKEPNAMTLATLGKEGFPKSRVVLLKAFSQEGFIFYTNYKSEKGADIQNHPQVGLSFFLAGIRETSNYKRKCYSIRSDTIRSLF